MKHRNPAAVFFLSLITFGIYDLVWHVKTKNELNKLGAHIPTAWLLIVPLANLYWVWKYCEGVEQVSGGQISAVLALILLLLLSIVGVAILQSEFNKLNLAPGAQTASPAGPASIPAAAPTVPVAAVTPTLNPTPPATPVPPAPEQPSVPPAPQPPVV